MAALMKLYMELGVSFNKYSVEAHASVDIMRLMWLEANQETIRGNFRTAFLQMLDELATTQSLELMSDWEGALSFDHDT